MLYPDHVYHTTSLYPVRFCRYPVLGGSISGLEARVLTVLHTEIFGSGSAEWGEPWLRGDRRGRRLPIPPRAPG